MRDMSETWMLMASTLPVSEINFFINVLEQDYHNAYFFSSHPIATKMEKSRYIITLGMLAALAKQRLREQGGERRKAGRRRVNGRKGGEQGKEG